jgi:hypothetical protein
MLAIGSTVDVLSRMTDGVDEQLHEVRPCIGAAKVSMSAKGHQHASVDLNFCRSCPDSGREHQLLPAREQRSADVAYWDEALVALLPSTYRSNVTVEGR